ncbi:1,4-alpha-glucan branching protein [Glutamicibacter sp. FBE19]|uniref:maltokinase N-terminal cap-like domain-containing protein n=1 Tax=Glutamicibacter sp. FBE19 TaxID=2761534 RepID=UPI0018966685|nr:1,4-alpha-glucan branching protein [Glutamicibacter sp. FBE19]MBF6671258.1 1,4-alpha-glucan branching protein [Glutamicibacter sp. FBE19]
MGIVYNTSMSPSKNELVSAWLPKQEFYTGKGTPKLQHIGGFRLEDPEGQVGVELRIYADHSDTSDVVYHLPLTYRDAPLPGGEKYLIGTSEHAILGKRYIYDAAGDPVFTAQARQLLAGNATAQHHSESFTDDPRIKVNGNPAGKDAVIIRKPVSGASGVDGVIGCWENALGQDLAGLVLRTA